MYKCNRCKKSFKKYESLSKHTGRVHKIHSTDFYVEYNLNGNWPLCKCGCGNKVKWSYQLKGFRDYCQGHQARILNNWGHNPIAISRSAETRRKQYASGERKTWNNGLTINDPRVKDNVKKCKDAINSNPNELKRRSDLMKQNRFDGTIPTLHGPDHSQWKGGTSSINILVRARAKLYKKWKYPILCRDGFKCIQCGSSINLHVHHDKEQMCEIIEKHIVDEEPKTFDMKEAIADMVVEYHINNKVSGITLCGDCHGKIHPSLNL